MNTGVGCHILLLEIFLTQGLNPGTEAVSPAWQADSLPSEPPGKLMRFLDRMATLLLNF